MRRKKFLKMFKKLFSKKRYIRLTALTTMCIIFTSCVITVNALSREYMIIDKDKVVTLKVINSDTDKMLEKANIELAQNDVVVRNDKNATVTVKRAFKVNIHHDGATIQSEFVDGNVGYALDKVGLMLGDYDYTEPDINTALTENMDINVVRCCQITISDANKKNSYIVKEGTLKEALEESEITLSKDDKISESLNTPVEDDMFVSIDRVGYNISKKTQIIPYKTSRVPTADLAVGETQIETKGVKGKRVLTIKKKFVNGKLKSEKVIKKQTVTKVVNEIILVGTGSSTAEEVYESSENISSSTATVSGNTLIDQNGKTVSYKSVLTGSATAYTAEAGTKTATGRTAQFGYVAVNPSIIPYGTKLYICSPDGSFVYGYAIAADTGGALMDGSALVDCYYPTYAECSTFGRRTMCVYILD